MIVTVGHLGLVAVSVIGRSWLPSPDLLTERSWTERSTVGVMAKGLVTASSSLETKVARLSRLDSPEAAAFCLLWWRMCIWFLWIEGLLTLGRALRSRWEGGMIGNSRSLLDECCCKEASEDFLSGTLGFLFPPVGDIGWAFGRKPMEEMMLVSSDWLE